MKMPYIMLILNLLCSAAYSQEPNYGLEFYSFEVTQEKRTSLNLTPEKPLAFDDGFTLSFDMHYPFIDQMNYGYVFRLVGNNGQHIDFLVSLEKLQVVNSDGKLLANSLLSDIPDFQNAFFKFSMFLDIRKNKMQVSIGENTFTPESVDLKDFTNIRLIFGKSDVTNLQSSDVPKIILKNIRINDFEGTLLYHWKLFKYAENGNVYDESGKICAKAENPKWLVDEHAFWKRRIDLQTRNNPQITFDTHKNLIAIVDTTCFRLYDTRHHSICKKLNINGIPHSQSANQIIYNPLDSIFYSYCFNSTSGRHVAAFDLKNNRLDNSNLREDDIEFWHHNRIISQEDSCLYIFCGYGHHKYKNIINKYSFRTDKWEQLNFTGDTLPPRYLGGLGALDDHRILIFGGYGSQTGMQEFIPRNYYDLYVVNLRTLESKKIYELPAQKDNFTVANSLVVDTVENCFYALCFQQNISNTCLYLAKFSLEKPEFKIVSDSIPYPFNDISSYADLYLNRETKELIAITFGSVTKDTLATVSIFSLACPPMSANDVFQKIHSQNDSLLLIISILAIISLLLAVYFIRKKRSSDENACSEADKVEETVEAVAEKVEKQEAEKRNEILLFGNFEIKNEAGVNFAGSFSPFLKQLFLIALFYSIKDEKNGVSFSKLKDTFWFDKSYESAQNNQSVMLNKIRKIIKNVGDLSIDGKKSKWLMTFGDNVYCDYREAVSIMTSLKQPGNNSKHVINRLVAITSGGDFIPDIQTEWLDPFKADFVNNLIDCLLSNVDRHEFSLQERVDIADTIMLHDVLNEDALKLKCTSLVKMGKYGLAGTIFDSFAKDYKKLFNTDFGVSFNEVVS